MTIDIGEVLSRAWQITWKHKILWAITALPVLIIFLAFPFMILFFVFAFSDVNSETNFRNIMWMAIGFSALFTPIMVLVQGIAMIYLKSSLMITYLRLTRGSAAQLVLLEAASL